MCDIEASIVTESDKSMWDKLLGDFFNEINLLEKGLDSLRGRVSHRT